MNGLTASLSRWLRGSCLFVYVRGTSVEPPTGLIPWFSKTEGNTYATLLHHPFLFKGKPAQCSRGSKKNFWHRCRGGLRTSQDIPSTHQKLFSITLHYLPFCLSFSSPPLHPYRFIHPLSLSSLSFRSPLFRLPVVMASPLSVPLSPEFEVLHFKQRQGENLKDAWFRMMES